MTKDSYRNQSACLGISLPMEQDDGEEARCRYCFDGADAEELIAPCDCSGSQRYVHLSCLHKWQAHRLLEAASTERHHPNPKRFEVCEVCHGPEPRE